MTPFWATLSSFSDVTIQDLMLERLTKRECLQKYLLWEGEWDIHISKLKISSNVITFACILEEIGSFYWQKCTYWIGANNFRHSKTSPPPIIRPNENQFYDEQMANWLRWCEESRSWKVEPQPMSELFCSCEVSRQRTLWKWVHWTTTLNKTYNL